MAPMAVFCQISQPPWVFRPKDGWCVVEGVVVLRVWDEECSSLVWYRLQVVER